jgi:hypothetical protein
LHGILSTQDGTNSGFDLEFVRDIKAAVSIPVIASSGVSTVNRVGHRAWGLNMHTKSPRSYTLEHQKGAWCCFAFRSGEAPIELESVANLFPQAGKPEHFVEVFEQCDADAALAAGIFHRREVPIVTVKDCLRASHIPCRSTPEQ